MKPQNIYRPKFNVKSKILTFVILFPTGFGVVAAGILGGANKNISIDGNDLFMPLGIFAIFIPLLFCALIHIGDRKKRVEINSDGIGLYILNLNKVKTIPWNEISAIKFEDDGFEKRFLISQLNSENIGVIQYPLRNWGGFCSKIVEILGEEQFLSQELKKRTAI